VLRTRIVDNVTTAGTASYEIDVPNGGAATSQGNWIQQSAATQNPNIVAYGEEGAVRPNPSLVVSGNLLQNFRTAGATGVLNRSSVVASVTGNRLYQIPTPVSGPNTQSGNVRLSAPVAISVALYQRPEFLTCCRARSLVAPAAVGRWSDADTGGRG